MIRYKLIKLVMAIFTIFTMVVGWSAPGVVVAQSNEVVSVELTTNSTSAKLGDTITVTVTANPVESIFGVQFELMYNPNQLRLMVNGAKINDTVYDVWHRSENTDEGLLKYALTAKSTTVNSQRSVAGSFQFEVVGVGEGMADFHLSGVKVTDFAPKYVHANEEYDLSVPLQKNLSLSEVVKLIPKLWDRGWDLNHDEHTDRSDVQELLNFIGPKYVK